MSSNHNDPCEPGIRRLNEIHYDTIDEEVRRLNDINKAEETAIEYQKELQRIAGLLVQKNNMCLGRPGDIWVTVEIYEGNAPRTTGRTQPAAEL